MFDFWQALGKATHGIVKEPIVKNHKSLLNGDLEFLGRQNRSSSEVSEGWGWMISLSVSHVL